MKQIDLRSDTVTKPSAGMMEAMMTDRVGDDVYGEDPTVNELEALAAKMLGTEDAIFCTSGTQSNLLALLVHCDRGDEYIVGQHAHTYRYEGGGAAVFGSIQPQPLDFEENGTLNLEKVSQFIKPDDFHYANTKLLCLENTQAGKVLPLEYLEKANKFATDNGLILHLDGARIFNAAIKLKVDVKKITTYFDTISCCLSKGLGAPVGSVLCGSKNQIEKARRWRKVLGGGMRQAGILAAAGIFALLNNIQRLEKDHEKALILAKGLSEINHIHINMERVQTNILFADIKADMNALCSFLKEKGILIDNSNHLRLVTHLDISTQDIEAAIQAFKAFFY
ncbi:low-specificity L-threonine aldolase [Desulfobacula sp.]|uniref:low-specificity L-threonine aldolase n=1 Tax=Desulfobacula sp. TaxID=2593537 RepID=UPI0025C1FDB6|nr:low-specificity L-threonine aldolase [Desulfobacula sp.]MBC2703194.1 low-specificity L-threonine aldolase [Desulfobacula sp.]